MAIGVLVAALVGLAIAVQSALLGSSTHSAHPLVTSCVLMLPGIAVGAIWSTAAGRTGDASAVVRAWWWVPLGVLGWMIVAAIGFAVSRTGIGTTLAVSVAAQLLVAAVLDARAGTAPIDPCTLAGLALVLSGAALLATRT